MSLKSAYSLVQEISGETDPSKIYYKSLTFGHELHMRVRYSWPSSWQSSEIGTF